MNIELGFGPSPRPRTIYANRQYTDCLWYFWNRQADEHSPIKDESLTCEIVSIEIFNKQTKRGDQAKLHVTVKADRLYRIESGIESLFSQGLIKSLDKIPNDKANMPLSIVPEAGDDDSVLFCRIYSPRTGNSIRFGNETDYHSALERVLDKYAKTPKTAQAAPIEQPKTQTKKHSPDYGSSHTKPQRRRAPGPQSTGEWDEVPY